MELNINTPAYFKEHHGIDNEVYRFCQNMYLYFKDKEYSDNLHTIGIIPIVAPQELYDSGVYKEAMHFINNKSSVVISLKMDFEKYYSADSITKIAMTKDLILKATKKLKSKCKFDYEAFEKDLDKIYNNN